MSKHTHNRQFFSTLNNDTCYWAGFIAADGNVYPPNGCVRIALSLKDKSHVDNFKIMVNATSPVRIIHPKVKYKNITKTYDAAQIDIYGARELQDDLNKYYNITANKSLTLKPPKIIEESHVRAFIRGYMDGDGSIAFCRNGSPPTLSFLGTQELLSWMINQISIYVKDIKKVSINDTRKSRPTKQICYSGRDIIAILNWIYDGSSDQNRLLRKYEKYLDVLEFYRNRKSKNELISDAVSIYQVNDYYFNNMHTESCYWAGFLFNHSHVFGYKICVSMKSDDKYHLEKLVKTLSFTGPIHQYKKSSFITIHSSELIQGLITNFNYAIKKDCEYTGPNLVNPKYLKSFIAGYIDSRSYSRNLGLCVSSQSQEFLSWLSNNISAHCGVDGKIVFRKNRNSIHLQYSCPSTRKLLSWLNDDEINRYRLIKT